MLAGVFAFLTIICAFGCTVFQDSVDAYYSGIDEATDSSFPTNINGIWLIDGQAWYMTDSSIAYCEDGRSIDFPTYKVCWSAGQQKFYYIQKRTLFSYDPASTQTVELCKIDKDAHYLKTVTDNYAIVAEDRGTQCFQVDLNTFEVHEITAIFEFPLNSHDDRVLYCSSNSLYEYSCKQKKSVRLYEAADTESRLVSACYMNDDILFVYRWGDFKEYGTLYRYDRETGTVRNLDISGDAAAICWAENTLLCAGAEWNSENYGNLHLYKLLSECGVEEIDLVENLPYTALVDICRVATDGQRFAISCRGDIFTGTLE